MGEIRACQLCSSFIPFCTPWILILTKFCELLALWLRQWAHSRSSCIWEQWPVCTPHPDEPAPSGVRHLLLGATQGSQAPQALKGQQPIWTYSNSAWACRGAWNKMLWAILSPCGSWVLCKCYSKYQLRHGKFWIYLDLGNIYYFCYPVSTHSYGMCALISLWDQPPLRSGVIDPTLSSRAMSSTIQAGTIRTLNSLALELVQAKKETWPNGNNDNSTEIPRSSFLGIPLLAHTNEMVLKLRQPSYLRGKACLMRSREWKKKTSSWDIIRAEITALLHWIVYIFHIHFQASHSFLNLN